MTGEGREEFVRGTMGRSGGVVSPGGDQRPRDGDPERGRPMGSAQEIGVSWADVEKTKEGSTEPEWGPSSLERATGALGKDRLVGR